MYQKFRNLITHLKIISTLAGRGKGLKSAFQKKQNTFPSFPTVASTEAGSAELQTRFPPKGRPEPAESTETTESPIIKPDGRKPRVKSNLKLAKKNFNKSKSKLNQSDFARRFLRNRSRFGTNNKNKNNDKNNQITEKPNSESSESIEATTIDPSSRQSKSGRLGGLFPIADRSSTTEKSRLSFADLFAENPLPVKPDGRKPRVKSNIKQRLADNGKPFAESHKIAVPSDLFEPKNHDKRRIDPQNENSVNLEDINEVKSKLSQLNNNVGGPVARPANNGTNTVSKTTVSKQGKKTFHFKNKADFLAQLKSGNIDPFGIGGVTKSINHEPVVRPDGQKPRVKSNILAASKKEILAQKKDILAQLINQSSDHEPIVRPDGQKPRVKSNILAAAKQTSNKNGAGGSKSGFSFRHSKKVDTDFVFEPTTLRPLTEPEETSTAESTPELTTPIESSTFPTQTATTYSTTDSSETLAFQTSVTSTVSTSLLDIFLSTQVLNTRAVDPTLASLHEKMKEEFKEQKQLTKRRKRKSKSKKKDLSSQKVVNV